MTWTNTRKAGVFGIVVLLAMVATTAIIFRHKIANQIALAGGRRAVANHTAVPLDLNDIDDGSASTFNKSPVWEDTPIGFQVFNHVPLQIEWGCADLTDTGKERH